MLSRYFRCAVPVRAVEERGSIWWSSQGSTTDAMKLFLDPRQAHVKTIPAELKALLDELGRTHQCLLLSASRGTGNNKGHTRRDPADDRNAGHHHHGAHQTTRKRDRHVIPIPRGRYGGDGPPETVTPRTERAARNTSLEQPHGRAAKKHHASGHAGDHDGRPHRGGTRDRIPGSTHEILLTRHCLRQPSAWASWISFTRSDARVRAVAGQYGAVHATRGIDVTPLAAQVAATGSVVPPSGHRIDRARHTLLALDLTCSSPRQSRAYCTRVTPRPSNPASSSEGAKARQSRGKPTVAAAPMQPGRSAAALTSNLIDPAARRMMQTQARARTRSDRPTGHPAAGV